MSQKRIKAGDIFQINEGGSVTVIECLSALEVIIQHNDDREHKAVVRSYNLRLGKVKNPYRKAVCGVGFVGVGDHKVRDGNKDSPAYRSWSRILQRAYTEDYHKRCPTYAGVTVCLEWQNFQSFAGWWSKEPNSGRKGFHLDKDLRSAGNTEYSPDACSFLPGQVNTLLGSSGALRGTLPQGVTSRGKRFHARICVNCKTKSLGIYSTPDQAYQVYRAAKEHAVWSAAEKWKTSLHPEVYAYLSVWRLAQ